MSLASSSTPVAVSAPFFSRHLPSPTPSPSSSPSPSPSLSDDFPFLCVLCLGVSPLVRMTRLFGSRPCKICLRPFPNYRWQPDAQSRRFKKTEICKSCAIMKNVCQTCILDINTMIPTQIRDSIIHKQNPSSLSLSSSRHDTDLYQFEKKISSSSSSLSSYQNDFSSLLQENPHIALIAKRNPMDFRKNNTKVCSFWLRGICGKGDHCEFRHEIPNYLGQNHLGIGEKNPKNKTQNPNGNQNQNFQKRYFGAEDKGAMEKQKIFEKQKEQNNITVPSHHTIFVTLSSPSSPSPFPSLSPSPVVLNEISLRPVFSRFGPINFIRIKEFPLGAAAFIQFATEEGARNAMETMRKRQWEGEGQGQFQGQGEGREYEVKWAKNGEKFIDHRRAENSYAESNSHPYHSKHKDKHNAQYTVKNDDQTQSDNPHSHPHPPPRHFESLYPYPYSYPPHYPYDPPHHYDYLYPYPYHYPSSSPSHLASYTNTNPSLLLRHHQDHVVADRDMMTAAPLSPSPSYPPFIVPEAISHQISISDGNTKKDQTQKITEIKRDKNGQSKGQTQRHETEEESQTSPSYSPSSSPYIPPSPLPPPPPPIVLILPNILDKEIIFLRKETEKEKERGKGRGNALGMEMEMGMGIGMGNEESFSQKFPPHRHRHHHKQQLLHDEHEDEESSLW